jgi:hypothetical protein
MVFAKVNPLPPIYLSTYQNYIVEALENGHQVDSIYEDFSKVFDRVHHNILIHKLRLMNFDGMFVNWLESFISDRSQLVKIGKCLSNPIEVKSGVPQGSHCRPLLFDLFINNIVLCVQFSKLLLFADDLKIFIYNTTSSPNYVDYFSNWSRIVNCAWE